ncbi:hypothetical protein ACJ73_09310 [Blastomyces percursus]|uniref:HNH nuclease domain-containing protein n=1 Tax=Blastomyces percursus TaxID=1658174 RepID=A0A1J9P9U6_9EURO|nr:hypothetical protein ACJ73_09310 [Blastomyces percursus]
MESTIIGGSDAESENTERVKLIERILRALQKYEQSTVSAQTHLSELIWSCLWLSNLDSLAEMTVKFENEPDIISFYLQRIFPESGLKTLWTGRPSTRCPPTPSRPSSPTTLVTQTQHDNTAIGPEPGTPARKRRRVDTSSPLSAPSTPQTSRSKKIADLCRNRDKNCVLTNATDPTNACHIVPYSLSKQSPYQLQQFWNILSLFWDKSTISELQHYVAQNSTETIENYLLMSPGVHVYWDAQLFALKPIALSPDKRSLKVQFFWLRPDNLDSLRLSIHTLPEDSSQAISIKPPTFPANLAQGGRKCASGGHPNIRIYNCETDERISSGQIITLTTEDPETMPLPDLKLLELQWILHRVFALAGAAGYREYEDWDDDDQESDNQNMMSEEPACVIFSDNEEMDSFNKYDKFKTKETFASSTSANTMTFV